VSHTLGIIRYRSISQKHPRWSRIQVFGNARTNLQAQPVNEPTEGTAMRSFIPKARDGFQASAPVRSARGQELRPRDGGSVRPDRRPTRLRDNPWVRAVARWLSEMGVRPNHVSVFSTVVSAASAACLVLVPTSAPLTRTLLYVSAAAGIPVRGLCNLCDGLMAVEGGLRTRLGPLYNDFPDRISDTLLLAAAGYSLQLPWGRELGWAAALLATMTAYVRTLGGCAGAPQPYCGPMDKTGRMALLAFACVAASIESGLGLPERAMTAALWCMVIGCGVTIIRRLSRIVANLRTG